MVEGAALEKQCAGNCTEGSNPSLSAKRKQPTFRRTVCFLQKRIRPLRCYHDGMMGYALFAMLLTGLLVAAILAFEIWMFVDAVTNRRLTDTEKILWCIGMLIFHPFVAIAYYLVVYMKKKT